MKRWGILVALLYVAALVVLSLPLLPLAFQSKDGGWAQTAGRLYGDWPLWAIFGIAGLCQFLFLAVPLARASLRPIHRRPLWLTVGVGALALALLAVGLYLAVVELATKRLPGSSEPWLSSYLPMALGAASWFFWFVFFLRKTEKPLVKTLLAGSILELLVAVPAHLIARQRDYCCAGMWTFLGLTTGVAVALLAFGPGVLALLLRRIHEKKNPEAKSRGPN